jgi:hypothetical protein
VASFHGDGQRSQTIVVFGKDICFWVLEQVLDDLHVAVLGGTHEGRGAILVADVDIGPGLDQELHHVQSAVADSQHQGGLAMLAGPDVDIS